MCSSTLSLISALYVGGCLAPRPDHFTPENPCTHCTGGPSVPQGRSGRGAENLVPTGIRYLKRPVRNDSIYRLSYRDPQNAY